MSVGPTPKAAVFLSYAGAQESAIFDVPDQFSRSGISVFLSQADDRDDWDRHVNNALSFADEVLVVISPFQTEFDPDAPPGFPTGHRVWLAIGSAWSRGIPIRGLLKGLSGEDVIAGQAISGFIKRIPLLDSVQKCADDLLRGLKSRQKPPRQRGLRCTLCICRGEDTPTARRLVERLKDAGFRAEWWLKADIERCDAAVVIPGSAPDEDWKRSAIHLVQDGFLNSRKPVALVTLPDTSEQVEVANLLPAPARVEYHESDDLTFLQIVWTIVGYRQYDFGTRPPIKEDKLRQPRSGVFISYSHKDTKWHNLLLESLAPLCQTGMKVWTDQQIEPGRRWHEEIQNRLDTVKVAILLVTPAYLNSKYVASEELPKMFAAAESEGLVLFWVPVIASNYKQTRIAQFQAAHDPSRPLSGLVGPRRAQALVDIGAKLSRALEGTKAGGAVGGRLL